MIWNSDSRFLFAVILLALYVPYHFIGFIIYFSKRNHEYIQPRCPILVSLCSLWFLWASINILGQEIINNYKPNNAEDYAYRYPCSCMDSVSSLSIAVSLMGNLRQQYVYVRFNWNLRQHRLYRKFLSNKFIYSVVALGITLSFILFGIQRAVGRGVYRRDLSEDRHCDLWEFIYIWIAVMVPSFFGMLKRSKQNLTVNDRFGVGKECMHVVGLTSCCCLAVAIINMVYQFKGGRNYIDTQYIPLHYLWVVVCSIVTWSYHYQPLLLIYLKEKSAEKHMRSNKIHSTAAAAAVAGAVELTASQLGAGGKRNSCSAINLPREGAAQMSDIALLLYILDDAELSSLFENHAKRSLCGEVVQFYQTANKLLIQSQQFQLQTQEIQDNNKTEENEENHEVNDGSNAKSGIEANFNQQLQQQHSPQPDASPQHRLNVNIGGEAPSLNDSAGTLIPFPEGYPGWIKEYFRLYLQFIVENSPFELNLPAALRNQFQAVIINYRNNLLFQEAENLELSKNMLAALEISKISRVSQLFSNNKQNGTDQKKADPLGTFLTFNKTPPRVNSQVPTPTNFAAQTAAGIADAPKESLSNRNMLPQKKPRAINFAKLQRSSTKKNKPISNATLQVLMKMNNVVVQKCWREDFTELTLLLTEALYECVNLIKCNLFKTFLHNPLHSAALATRLTASPLPSFHLQNNYQATATTNITITADPSLAHAAPNIERTHNHSPFDSGYSPLLNRFHGFGPESVKPALDSTQSIAGQPKKYSNSRIKISNPLAQSRGNLSNNITTTHHIGQKHSVNNNFTINIIHNHNYNDLQSLPNQIPESSNSHHEDRNTHKAQNSSPKLAASYHRGDAVIEALLRTSTSSLSKGLLHHQSTDDASPA
jgi:hypothetical protein